VTHNGTRGWGAYRAFSILNWIYRRVRRKEKGVLKGITFSEQSKSITVCSERKLFVISYYGVVVVVNNVTIVCVHNYIGCLL